MGDAKVLAGVDLNLLPVFAALLEHRSVTKAASVLYLSQPAVSRSLARLRVLFDDPLLVRQGNVMVLTAKAQELAPAVVGALRTLEAVTATLGPFDPATSNDWVRLSVIDGIRGRTAGLLRSIRDRAPNVQVELVSHAREDDLVGGRVDALFSFVPPSSPVLELFRWFDSGWECYVRPGSPLITGWSLDTWASATHVRASRPDPLGNWVQRACVAQGIDRRFGTRVMHLQGAVDAVLETDEVLTVPSGAMAELAELHGLVRLPLPLRLEAEAYACVVAIRSGPPEGSMHAWLRDLLVTELELDPL